MHLKELCQLLTSCNEPIGTLNLSNNMLTDSGLYSLCKALQSAQVEVIVLAKNRITEKGLDQVVVMLKANKELKSIDLTGNLIFSKGLKSKLKSTLSKSGKYGKGIEVLI